MIKRLGYHIQLRAAHFKPLVRKFSSNVSTSAESPSLTLFGETYKTDCWTNINNGIVSKLGRNLHVQECHPLNLIKKRIVNYFYKSFIRGGNPKFSVYENLCPVVTLEQNFDSLLVPADHISRSKSDSYYVNSEYMLRAHTSAHQRDLIKTGLDAFLVIGDVYRRDTIDASHYPVFHQVEGVKLFTEFELFKDVADSRGLTLFENGKELPEKQACHTMDAAKLLEHSLKSALLDLAVYLFGKDIEMRWVDCHFPFTHPSWELEIKFQGDWMEVLGCGITKQEILHAAGAHDKVAWAFGLGLERLAMRLYKIPDIRLFWSSDSGFLSQFKVDHPDTMITYKPVSQYPQCINDISFWVPHDFTANDFYDLVRMIGGNVVEQVNLVDQFTNSKTQRVSHCYRIVYRHMEKTLTQQEVNVIHKQIESEAATQLGVEIR